ncbi:MAG: HNH endonuclease [Proteobacteria bacterium]|nr:HNH endonuclease [Pseudomonadota bacterium]
MKEIKLTQGKTAQVSAEDFEWLTSLGKWQFDRYAYYTRKVNGKKKSVRMHRLIAEKMVGAIPEGMVTDHINGDKLDNRRENLRVVTYSANSRNRREECTKSYAPAGIYWDKFRKRWKVQTSICGKTFNVGRYDTLEEAKESYSIFLKGKGVII